MSGRKDDLNVKGAFLHMAADAAVSAGVVIAGILILYTGWHWLDPVTSLVINAVIVWGTWGLLRDATNLALDAVPAGIDPEKVKRHLAGLPGVVDVHHLHIWALSTTETALTVHLVKPMKNSTTPCSRARKRSCGRNSPSATSRFSSSGAIWGCLASRLPTAGFENGFPTYRSRSRFRERNRRAFAMTDTELKLIAAPAIIGLSSVPVNG